MSSNRPRGRAAIALLFAGAALLAGCAGEPKADPPGKGPLTPTQQFKTEVGARPDQVLLAPHDDGLSMAQVSALAQLVGRWRSAGRDPIAVQAPSHGGAAIYQSATAVVAELRALGVPEESVVLTGYEPGDHADPPIVVAFDHYEVKPLACGQDWSQFTSTMENKPQTNFGCAVTANMAALVANPADLAGPRRVDAADAERREVVLDKYRRGEITSASKDDQADASISDAVH